MKITCILGFHKWDGCECLKCERIRDKRHDWGKDCEKCAKCGTTRQNAHKWDGCKCFVCGKPALPDVTGKLTDADLFQLLGDRPIAMNVAVLFETTRRVVGGKIGLVDLYFENGIVLWNVRIAEECVVTIPKTCSGFPIRTVGVPDLERHRKWPPMNAELS